MNYNGTRPSNIHIFLRIAGLVALRATCPRRSVGCVLVDEHYRILATGYNGVASGAPHCIDPEHRCPGADMESGEGLDKCEAIHAEQNAVLLCPDPWKVKYAFVTTFPCVNCLKLLLGTSCEKIFYTESYPHKEAYELWLKAGREEEQIYFGRESR